MPYIVQRNKSMTLMCCEFEIINDVSVPE